MISGAAPSRVREGAFLIALVNRTIQANRISADWASCHIN